MATFVLVHGAGDSGWYWHLTEAELQARGHRTIAPDLPCDNDAASLEDYARTVADAAAGRQDLVIVSQSYGAFTATLAASQLPTRLLVLVAGMIPVREKPRASGGTTPVTIRPLRSKPSWTAAGPATTTRSLPTTTESRARWLRRPYAGAGAGSPRWSGIRPGRCLRGRTCPPSSSWARTTGSSPLPSCAGWRNSVWASSRTRFLAVTARRSAIPGS